MPRNEINSSRCGGEVALIVHTLFAVAKKDGVEWPDAMLGTSDYCRLLVLNCLCLSIKDQQQLAPESTGYRESLGR